VIWAEVWRGRHKDEQPAMAPNPIAAAFFRKFRRSGSPPFLLWFNLMNTSPA
jgi:hypothetical protein